MPYVPIPTDHISVTVRRVTTETEKTVQVLFQLHDFAEELMHKHRRVC